MHPASPAYICLWTSNVKLIGLAGHRFSVIALAVVALCSTFWLLLDVVGAVSHRQVFGVAAYENRFDGLRKIIKPHSVYGYISDNSPNDPADLAEFFLTQYTLAPAILKDSDDADLVIANFHTTKPNDQLLRMHRLVGMQDFGNGVLLCRKRRR